MTKYQAIITNLKNIDSSKSEYLEEEIDIILHKLKFLTEDNLPKTLVLDQKTNFQSIKSDILAEKIKIAGGKYTSSLAENPDCLILLQHDESLYGQITNILTNEFVIASAAYATNNIYIIQHKNFNTADEEFLKDVETLAEILQPKYFRYGHEGTEWIKFDIQ